MTGCPITYAGVETFEAIGFADLAAEGVLPVAGGALDQAQGFLDIMRLVSTERAHWRARRPSSG